VSTSYVVIEQVAVVMQRRIAEEAFKRNKKAIKEARATI
jgi:hypothetical protein